MTSVATTRLGSDALQEPSSAGVCAQLGDPGSSSLPSCLPFLLACCFHPPRASLARPEFSYERRCCLSFAAARCSAGTLRSAGCLVHAAAKSKPAPYSANRGSVAGR